MKSVLEKLLVLVDHPQGMQPLLDDLHNSPSVAVDTESNSLYAYFEQVCLIQFSTSSTDYLVDPLALPNEVIHQLLPLFANDRIQKVFHAAEYDLIVLSRDFGFTFNNLFDTMWAACIVGREEVGLGALLQAEFNLNLDKRYQKADWGKRPLADKLKEYAGEDTHYLLALRDKLALELDRCGRRSLAEEDFQRFCKIDGHDRAQTTYTDSIAADVSLMATQHHLNRTQSAVLEELFLFRDEVARAHNQPPFKIMPERMFATLAKACPKDANELLDADGVNSRLVKRYLDGLLKAVRRGVKKGSPSIHPPKHTGWRDDAYQNRYKALKEWRKNNAAKMGVKSDVVLARPLMEQIAREQPQSLEELQVILQDSPWRLANFGPALITLMQKVK